MSDKTDRTERLLMMRLLSDAEKALTNLGRHCNGKPGHFGRMAPKWLKDAEWMKIQADGLEDVKKEEEA